MTKPNPKLRPSGVRGSRMHGIGRNEAHEYDPAILLFQAVGKQKFGAATCFLCGRRLGTKNRADEHVIPKWVQKGFRLWNARLHLLNQTTIPYRQLTIPFCGT
jgi:hypothetical protein